MIILSNCFLCALVSLDGFPGGFLYLKLLTPFNKKALIHNRIDSSLILRVAAIVEYKVPSIAASTAIIRFAERRFPLF